MANDDTEKPKLMIGKLGGLLLIVLGFLLAASAYRAASTGYMVVGIVLLVIGIGMLVGKVLRRNQSNQR